MRIDATNLIVPDCFTQQVFVVLLLTAIQLKQSRYRRPTHLQVPGNDTLRRPAEERLNRCVTLILRQTSHIPYRIFHRTLKERVKRQHITKNIICCDIVLSATVYFRYC